MADHLGQGTFGGYLPPDLSGVEGTFQAVHLDGCAVSDALMFSPD